MNKELSPRWVSITSSVLLGWNIGLICAFLTAICISAVFRGLEVSTSSGIEIAIVSVISIGFGILSGVFIGKKVNGKELGSGLEI